jgi:excinuclease ABC subunit A
VERVVSAASHPSSSRPECIRLRGVRQNNLQGFDLDLPLGRYIAVTGLSGSGKSSLVFDTLHAEGQRRYVETFSAYTRQFLELLHKPAVDSIENIRPSIAIAQTNTVKTSRSTVGTMTELTDFAKVWFSHVAECFDPATGEKVEDDNPQTIWAKTAAANPDQTVVVAFKIAKPAKLTWPEILQNLRNQSYVRVLVPAPGGHERDQVGSDTADSPRNHERERVDFAPPTSAVAPLTAHRIDALLSDDSPLSASRAPLSPPHLFVAQDRLTISPENQTRFLEAVETALHFGQGQVFIFRETTAGGFTENGHYSRGLHSPKTGRTFRPATPPLFSFNSPLGACPKCRGFGRVIEIDYRLAIPDQSLSIDDGALKCWEGEVYSGSKDDLKVFAKRKKIPTNIPFAALTPEQRAFVIDGEPGYGEENGKTWPKYWYGVKGFFRWLEKNTYKMHVRVFLSRYRTYNRCPDCHGTRLQPEALCWRWQGRTLPELYALPVSELLALLTHNPEPETRNPKAGTPNPKPEAHSADLAYESMLARLRYLEQVGLGYLTLDRSSRTLSGGEVERVNLTSCLGTSLVDTLFVLDEPSVGLHSRDIDRLISIVRSLTDAGNTVIVVEHDEAMIRAADHVVEVGPEPGARGGHIVFQGNVDDLLRAPQSITGAYFSGRQRVDPPAHRRPVSVLDRESKIGLPPWLHFTNVTKHNLAGLSFSLPLQRLVCLSGVSGSGKSTLLDNVIYQGLLTQRQQLTEDPAAIEKIESDLAFSEIVLMDQSPLSRTPRSNPALYSEAWELIRDLFAATPAAQAAGFSASSFSFNSGDGRCDHCQGLGYERVEMQFLSDVFVPCPVCDSRRFKPEVLAIQWHGRSVSDLLNTSIDDALPLFAEHPAIQRRLAALEVVGLGYLTLGQPLNTLSGGEAQRLKLVRYLGELTGGSSEFRVPSTELANSQLSDPNSKPETRNPKLAPVAGALLLLDEPTTGLHRHDVKRLLGVLQQLVDRGHSVVVIEHNLDVLKSADWILEIGPEAGAAGGRIVAEGPPEEIARAATATSPFLRAALAGCHVLRDTPSASSSRTDAKCHVISDTPSASSPGTKTECPLIDDIPLGRVAECNPLGYNQGSAVAEASDGFTPKLGTRNLEPETRNPEPATSVPSLMVLGARENNLKNLSLTIPHRQLNVVTGVSGSGKSTLAFDIVFAEGQRRFMESMSPYARQFVEQLARPALDRVSGIPPTVAIEQRVTRGSRKSTVATITEVAQYLRLLYAKLGVQHHPDTNRPVTPLSVGQLKRLLTRVLATTKARKAKHLYLCAPLVRGRKGHHQPIATWIAAQGYPLMRADGRLLAVEAFVKLDRYKEHDIEVVVADLKREVRSQKPEVRRKNQPVTSSLISNLRPLTSAKALEQALKVGKGSCFLVLPSGEILSWFSTTRTDIASGESFPELDPKHFSHNSPRGWCPTCRGHGRIYDWMLKPESDSENELPVEIADLAANLKSEIENQKSVLCPDCHGARLNRIVSAVKLHLRGKQPPLSLPELLQSTPGELLTRLRQLDLDARGRIITQDIVPQIEERLKFLGHVGLGYLAMERATDTLSGGEAQRIRLAAQLGTNLAGVLYVLDEPSIGLHARDNDRLIAMLEALRDKGNTLLVVEHDDEMMARADHIIDLGPGAGVHGGELLASGTPAEIRKCDQSLTGLFLTKGISHPLRGEYRPVGAHLACARGRTRGAPLPSTVAGVADPGKTVTRVNDPGYNFLELTGARFRNLRGFDLRLPLGRLIMVAGPSGAGKSTLFRDLLGPAVAYAIQQKKARVSGREFVKSTGWVSEGSGFRRSASLLALRRTARAGSLPTVNRRDLPPPPFAELRSASGFRSVIEVDQAPIGKTPRSTPATYLGIFDLIRQFFASLPEAKIRGYTASRFSFNTTGGRCPTCEGAGRIRLEMAFMPDTYLPCDNCRGSRYGAELSDITWKGKTIGDVLQLTFEEAAVFFDFHSQLKAVCQLMVDCGLGYLTLGQSSPTLSGGEAQRLKLVTELSRGLQSYKERSRGVQPHNLYLLEEPTIGLHLSDCEKLIRVLHALVDQGHTVVVIEHHLDLLAEADWIVELGPDGGPAGGELIYQGPLAGLLKVKRSPTAPYLRKRLKG